MRQSPGHRFVLLEKILFAIRPRLSQISTDDIASFLEAGETALAADTIFCAISEESIAVDDDTLKDLGEVADLFNTFGDLDEGIATAVLQRAPRSHPVMR